MNNDNNNQQMTQNPANTSFPTPQPICNAGAPVVPQSQNGRWVPVDPATMGFTISGNMNTPVQGPDGAYYCISNSRPEYSSVQSNMNTAVPTPASIVQLPPIVQPIALVPFASQNQPLLQYDPNYRPQEPQTQPPTKYRLKPYRGISFVQVLCSIAIVVLLVLLNVIAGKNSTGSPIDWNTYNATGLDVIYGILAQFGLLSMDSAYFDKLLSVNFAGGLSAGFNSDFVLSLMYILIPAFVAIALITAIILVIIYLVKLGKMKTPRGFNIGAFIIFCLLGSVIAMIFAISKRENMSLIPGIALYIAAGLGLFMVIFNYFAKKNAYIIDETALKKVYILDEAPKA